MILVYGVVIEPETWDCFMIIYCTDRDFSYFGTETKNSSWKVVVWLGGIVQRYLFINLYECFFLPCLFAQCSP